MGVLYIKEIPITEYILKYVALWWRTISQSRSS